MGVLFLSDMPSTYIPLSLAIQKIKVSLFVVVEQRVPVNRTEFRS